MPGDIPHSPRGSGSPGAGGIGKRPGFGDTVSPSLRSWSVKAMSEVRACMSEGLSGNSPCVLVVEEHKQIHL